MYLILCIRYRNYFQRLNAHRSPATKQFWLDYQNYNWTYSFRRSVTRSPAMLRKLGPSKISTITKIWRGKQTNRIFSQTFLCFHWMVLISIHFLPYLYHSEFSIDIPYKTRRNGTMFLHLVLVNDIGVEFEWRNLKREGLTVLQRIPLTEYMVPRPATFNLLNENEVYRAIRLCEFSTALLISILFHTFPGRNSSTKTTKTHGTLETKHICYNFDWSLLRVECRYTTWNGPAAEVYSKTNMIFLACF